MRANVPGFILWGEIGALLVATNETWLCCEDESVQLQTRSEWNYVLGPLFLSLDERVNLSKGQSGFEHTTFDASGWSNAIPSVQPVKMMPALEPWKLFERPIPLMAEVLQSFDGALKCSGPIGLPDWNALLQREDPITIESNQTVSVDLEAS